MNSNLKWRANLFSRTPGPACNWESEIPKRPHFIINYIGWISPWASKDLNVSYNLKYNILAIDHRELTELSFWIVSRLRSFISFEFIRRHIYRVSIFGSLNTIYALKNSKIKQTYVTIWPSQNVSVWFMLYAWCVYLSAKNGINKNCR